MFFKKNQQAQINVRFKSKAIPQAPTDKVLQTEARMHTNQCSH
jgi:hypothetical protein